MRFNGTTKLVAALWVTVTAFTRHYSQNPLNVYPLKTLNSYTFSNKI